MNSLIKLWSQPAWIKWLVYLAIIYILFTIAYYGLLTPILFFNLISIACSLIHLKCNIDILLSCLSSYHSIISTYMDPLRNIKISTDDLIISSVTLFLAGLEFVINITMLGSIYFDTMKYAFKQLSSPTIHTLSKFIGIVCFCSRTCDHIKLTNYQTYTSFVAKNFSNPFKILKKFNIFTTNENTENATPNMFTKI